MRDPWRKAVHKQLWVDVVHTQRSQSEQGKFGKAAQEGEVRLAPIDGVVVIVAGRDSAAHHRNTSRSGYGEVIKQGGKARPR
jgi:hypothetical protein